MDRAFINEYKECFSLVNNDIEKCKCSKTIEFLISKNDLSKLLSTEKTLKAKEFNEKVKSQTLLPDDKTKENFKKLFEKTKLL